MSQPANSRAIFALAEELGTMAAADHNEIKYRSAVSRAYYAVFLLTRDKLGIVTQGTTDAHASVYTAFCGKERPHMVRGYYWNMKQMRKAADYDFPSPSPYENWADNWKEAKLRGPFLLGKIEKF